MNTSEIHVPDEVVAAASEAYSYATSYFIEYNNELRIGAEAAIRAALQAYVDMGRAMIDDEWFGEHLHRFIRIRLDNPAGEKHGK